MQRQEGTVVTLDDDTNNFPRQTEVDVAAFDGLIDRVGEDRLREMKGRFDGADMIGRHRLRVEHGYTATDMLAYYVWRMKGQAGEQDAAKGNAYYRTVMELDPRAIDAAEKAGAADRNLRRAARSSRGGRTCRSSRTSSPPVAPTGSPAGAARR